MELLVTCKTCKAKFVYTIPAPPLIIQAAEPDPNKPPPKTVNYRTECPTCKLKIAIPWASQ